MSTKRDFLSLLRLWRDPENMCRKGLHKSQTSESITTPTCPLNINLYKVKDNSHFNAMYLNCLL